MTEHTIDKGLQTMHAIIKEVCVIVVLEPSLRRQRQAEHWEQSPHLEIKKIRILETVAPPGDKRN